LLLEEDMGKNWIQDKVVVITGGASGIGAALAYKFGKEGARIALLDTDAAALKEQERKLTREGVPAIARKCDISSEPECGAAIAAIIQHYGGIDLLFNNAGITGSFPGSEYFNDSQSDGRQFFWGLALYKSSLGEPPESKRNDRYNFKHRRVGASFGTHRLLCQQACPPGAIQHLTGGAQRDRGSRHDCVSRFYAHQFAD